MVHLQTERLIIRDPLPHDIDDWHRLLSDPVTMYYLPDLITRSPDESKANLEIAISESQSLSRTKYFFSIEHGETQSFIGTVGYTVTQTTPFGRLVEAGYFILPEYHGYGYVTEAMKEVVRFAFENDNVFKVGTGCLSENRASERVMQKCGLIKEAEFKSHTLHDGRMKDRVEYRIIKDEWLSMGSSVSNKSKIVFTENDNNEPVFNIFTETMADYKWPDIQHYAERDAIVLLPMGVIEEHGPHLCLATDIYTAHIDCFSIKHMLEEKGYPTIIAPPFYWGICQAGRGFIGSFNIRPETAKDLLFDILSSIKEFGFNKIFAVNAHGDVEHKIVAMNAFKAACEQLDMTACFPFDDFMLQHLGLNSAEPFFYNIKPQEIKVSEAKVSDVHAGDIETATVYQYYPHLVDTEMAKSLPDVSLGDNFEAWMFGGQLKKISPLGYLGSPASYETVDIRKNIEDNAKRITSAIITRLSHG